MKCLEGCWRGVENLQLLIEFLFSFHLLSHVIKNKTKVYIEEDKGLRKGEIVIFLFFFHFTPFLFNFELDVFLSVWRDWDRKVLSTSSLPDFSF